MITRKIIFFNKKNIYNSDLQNVKYYRTIQSNLQGILLLLNH